MYADGGAYYHSIIDPEMWGRAGWQGMVYMHDSTGTGAPYLGFGFRNIAAGRQIFQAWHGLFLDADEDDEIRISIIEGPWPNGRLGYGVSVGLEIEAISKIRNERPNPEEYVITTNRCQFIDTPFSPSLEQFKQDVAKHKVYWVIPAHMPTDDVNDAVPVMDLGIMKSRIYFRNLSEISEGDPDCHFLNLENGL